MASLDPNIECIGIAPLLAAASEELAVGSMVQSSAFSLFEAMSAVEIGNPKMDAGARPKQNVPLAERPLPLDLAKPQLLAWMDRLLALEATWHVGGALAQTVYSSLHMMQIPRLAANPVMSAYARALQALCRDVNALVLQGCVCEEEDFVCHSAGLPLEEPPEPQEKLLAALSAAADACGVGAKGAGEADARLSAALLCRVQLRRLLHQAVARMRQRTKQDLDAASKLLSKAAAELAAARASAALADAGGGGGDGGWAALGFDAGLNSHLAPPAPPRIALSRGEAFSYFEGLLDQLGRACRITAVADFPAMEQFVLAYSAARPCAALIAVGNWAQAVLLNPARHRRRLRRGLEDWCHLYQHAVNADCSDALAAAVGGAGWGWRGGRDYPGPLGPLSAWVERQTARVVAAHLLMGFELELYEPRDYASIYWYVEYLLRVVDADSNVLAGSRPSPATIEAAAKAAGGGAAAAGRAKRPPGKGGKGLAAPKGLGGGGGGGAVAAAAPPAASAAAARAAFASDQLLMAQAAALRPLCQGLMQMCVGLEAAGVLAPPPLPFNGPRERFEQRYGSLHVLTKPDAPTYEAFEAAADLRGAPAEAALSAAGAALGKAAAAFKALALVPAPDHGAGGADLWARDCAALARAAAQNQLACMVACRAAAAGAALDLSFEFHHRWFPVAVLKSKKEPGRAGAGAGAGSGASTAASVGAA
ncbi:MAG: Mak10 subunit, NatC N-terminal acetyltransferase-domain-containing protein [Monoraphidium minutum]|nr:MAG: Mak10 subunit, NatC N-terminal acetyltransferase-domain-containing protein [Monoraphidium minutum]